LVVVALALWWAQRAGLSRRDGGLMALATAFPNTGFLGLPLLTGLLGAQAAGPVAATIVIDVLLLSSLCLAWAHSHTVHGAQDADQAEARQAAWASLKGALRNPLLWSVALGMGMAELGWHLPHAADETVRLLGLSATPAALFTLGAVVARAQLQPEAEATGSARQASQSRSVAVPVALKLVAHPVGVAAWGAGLAAMGHPVSPTGLLTLTLAAALPSASNVSMLAEREGAQTALVARLILWTTAGALLTLTAWAHVLGVQAAALTT
jgi:malonate transporter